MTNSQIDEIVTEINQLLDEINQLNGKLIVARAKLSDLAYTLQKYEEHENHDH